MSDWTLGLQRGDAHAHYLWHLHDAGVLSLSHQAGEVPRYRVDGAVWDGLYDREVPSSLVAVIDTGCCTDHPHLPHGEAVLPAPCFASHDFGATHPARGAAPEADGEDPTKPTASREGRVNHFEAAAREHPGFWARIEALTRRGQRHAPMDRLRETIAELRRTEGVARAVTSYAEDFPIHGTLTAGVVAARPPEGRPDALPYLGVDPRARVLPLATSMRPGFRGLIHALLYAVGMGADAICIPRSIWRPDAWDFDPDPHRPDDLRASRLDTDTALQVDAALFEVLLHVVGEHTPVLMAAGNNGFAREQIYPARLAQEGNGLISVGALSAGGPEAAHPTMIAGYSNTQGVTIYAPSDDAEVWDRTRRRLDPDGRTARDHAPQDPGEPFSGWGVLSTDIPGAFGDADGGMDVFRPEEAATRRSLFAPFGGTSAACAVAAGVASLIQAARRRSGEEPFTGPEMKRHMLRHCPTLDGPPGAQRVQRIDARACIDAL